MSRTQLSVPALARMILALRLHVALVPIVITWFFEEALGYRVDTRYYVIVALNTLAGYWINILSDATEDRANRRAFQAVAEHRKLLGGAAAICFLLSFSLALKAGWPFVLFGFVLNFLGALYGAKLRLPGRPLPFRIKAVLGLKNLYAALFWSAALLLGPFVYAGLALGPSFLWVTLSVFFTAWYIELLWDLRDLPGDAAAGVRTIPVRFGAARSAMLLHILGLASAAAMAAAAFVVDPGLPWRTSIVVAAASALFTEISRRARDKDLFSHLYLAMLGLIFVASKELTHP